LIAYARCSGRTSSGDAIRERGWCPDHTVPPVRRLTRHYTIKIQLPKANVRETCGTVALVADDRPCADSGHVVTATAMNV